MTRRAGSVIGLIVLLALSGCSDGADEASPDDAVESEFFQGTPEEYTELHRACLEEMGFETADEPGGVDDGFMIGVGDRSQDEITRASEDCREELGEPQMAGLPDSELRSRYEARVEQWECLVDNGLISGSPISFEVFVEDYNRSGQQVLWEPTAEARGTEVGGVPKGPTDVCPRSGAW